MTPDSVCVYIYIYIYYIYIYIYIYRYTLWCVCVYIYIYIYITYIYIYIYIGIHSGVCNIYIYIYIIQFYYITTIQLKHLYYCKSKWVSIIVIPTYLWRVVFCYDSLGFCCVHFGWILSKCSLINLAISVEVEAPWAKLQTNTVQGTVISRHSDNITLVNLLVGGQCIYFV